MRLLIVSHTAHHRGPDGGVVGWGPTVREISALAEGFGEVIHVAPLHDGPPPAVAEPYRGPVRLRPVAPAGGRGPLAKAAILGRAPGWAAAILDEMRGADAIHVRCPANISLVALAVVALRAGVRPVWVKYAGSWEPPPGTPLASRLQRWWVGRARDWWLTVNAGWDLPAHATALPNPCLHESELAAARVAALAKLPPPARLLFVGRLEREKGADVAVETALLLRGAGRDIRLDLAGDGSLRPALERRCRDQDAGDAITFHGWCSRDRLFDLYRTAHHLLLPSRSEGWPKAIAEGMAHGVVPIAAAVGSIPHYLERYGVGRAVPPDAAPAGYEAAVEAYRERPETWRGESRAAAEAAAAFTYEAYVETIVSTLVRPGRDAGRPGG